MSKVVVYTAIFGNKDDAPKLINKEQLGNLDIAFVCVTDNPDIQTSDYEVKLVERRFSDITKNARNIKINGFDGIDAFDIAIWHDSSVQLHCDKLHELAVFGEDHMMSAFHHVRYCVYLETIACIDQKKDNPITLTKQVYRYFSEGFPANFGLHETTIMVINLKTYLQSELRTIWWKEIADQSRRDQISLPYARWRSGTEVNLLAHWSVRGHSNEFSAHVGHRYAHYNDPWSFSLATSYPVRMLCKKLLYEMRRRR